MILSCGFHTNPLNSLHFSEVEVKAMTTHYNFSKLLSQWLDEVKQGGRKSCAEYAVKAYIENDRSRDSCMKFMLIFFIKELPNNTEYVKEFNKLLLWVIDSAERQQLPINYLWNYIIIQYQSRVSYRDTG